MWHEEYLNISYMITLLNRFSCFTLKRSPRTSIFALVFLMFAGTLQVHAQDDAAGADAAAGEALFKKNCQSCHSTGADKQVGPGLKGVDKKHDLGWLTKWINNSQAMIAAGDPAAVKIAKEFNNMQMTSFPNITEADVKNMLAFINKANEAPAAGAVAAGAAVAGGGQSSGEPSTLFVVVIVALLVVMVLVLGVLLVVLSILSKTVKGARGEVESKSQDDGTKDLLTRISLNPAVRAATVWVFLLLIVKYTLDGAFSIGVQQGYAPKQPIAFSHKLHAGEYKIDCNYCHTGVNRTRSAHIPAANICMNCHGVIKKESPEIQKIYEAIENDKPIEWVRVHNLPDLAYFNHSQHVNVGGLECQQCHGDIEKMEVVEQRSSLTMGWCIDCHRTTDVNTKGNAYYDKLVQLHGEQTKDALKVADIGGLECSKCHY